MGWALVLQGSRQKRLLAALNDVAQSESADATIKPQREDSAGIEFSFTFARPDGVTCRVDGSAEVSPNSVCCGVLNDFPEGSTQKVLYLRADPQVCRLEKLAQNSWENCNNSLMFWGAIMLLAYGAPMFAFVYWHVWDRGFILGTVVIRGSAFLVLLAMNYGRGPCGMCGRMSRTFPGDYHVTECDDVGQPLQGPLLSAAA